MLADFTTRGDIHQRNTRNAHHLALPAIRSKSGRRRFKCVVVAAYNDLPASIRDLEHGVLNPRPHTYHAEKVIIRPRTMPHLGHHF